MENGWSGYSHHKYQMSLGISRVSYGAGWRWFWISKAFRVCHREEAPLRWVLLLGCCFYSPVHSSWNRLIDHELSVYTDALFQGLWIPALLKAITPTTSWVCRIPMEMFLDKKHSALGSFFLSWLQTARRFLAFGAKKLIMVRTWLRKWRTLSIILVWRLHIHLIHSIAYCLFFLLSGLTSIQTSCDQSIQPWVNKS